MTVKEALTPAIEQEFEKYRAQGYKIRLKSTINRRIIYFLICLAVACIPAVPVTQIGALVAFVVCMRKTTPVDIIIGIAKKNPDTPVEMIIAQEMKL